MEVVLDVEVRNEDSVSDVGLMAGGKVGELFVVEIEDGGATDDDEDDDDKDEDEDEDPWLLPTLVRTGDERDCCRAAFIAAAVTLPARRLALSCVAVMFASR